MRIYVTTSTGEGSTKLAAFDTALNAAGVANYNLLVLSSVIPPQSELMVQEGQISHDVMAGDWGDRLYVVMAQNQTDVIGQEVWAGIGWVQDSVTGKGLFVEHEGDNEASVRQDIDSSLRNLMMTRGVDFGEIHMVVSGATCTDKPVCAMAVAAYQASDWHNDAKFLGA